MKEIMINPNLKLIKEDGVYALHNIHTDSKLYLSSSDLIFLRDELNSNLEKFIKEI